MGHMVVGVFKHSGDADLAAAHLRDEYTLGADELDIIGEAEWENLTPPAPEGESAWYLTAATGVFGLPAALGDEEPLGKRWIDKLYQGDTLVVARSNDPDVAQSIARDLRSLGADRIDLLPH